MKNDGKREMTLEELQKQCEEAKKNFEAWKKAYEKNKGMQEDKEI